MQGLMVVGLIVEEIFVKCVKGTGAQNVGATGGPPAL